MAEIAAVSANGGDEATYEQLAELEKQFVDVEMQIIVQQNALSEPLYTRRSALIAKIPNFWGLVLENSPLDIEQFIQPADHPVLIGSLTDITVSRFEIPTKGSPRSVAIDLHFSDNEYFPSTTLQKKFWFRHQKGGEFAGLVSEPVRIPWKAGKDLTEGLLDAACDAFEAEQKTTQNGNGATNGKDLKKRTLSPEQKKLAGKMEKIAQGTVSFFAWFGFRGRAITAEESKEAEATEKEKRRKIRAGEKLSEDDEADAAADVDDEEDLEIFPDGDELAISISEDLYPNALKYYMQGEMENLSDMDSDDAEMFEGAISDSDDEEANNQIRKLVQHVKKREAHDHDRPNKKKQKSSED